MKMQIFKNVSESSSYAHDKLREQRTLIPPGGLTLVEEREAKRLSGLPGTFKLEREVVLADLLKEVLEETQQPASNLHSSPITEGKILFLFDSEGRKYIGQRIWEFQLGIQLAEMGYSVHFLTDEVPPYVKEWPGSEKVTWERGGATNYLGFDFIIGTPPQNLEKALEYGKANGIPVIFICGELVSAIPGKRHITEDEIVKLDGLFQQAHAVIAPSETMRQRMIASGVDPSRVLAIEPVVNPQLLTIPVQERDGAPSEVVLCGRLDYHKQLVPTIRSLLAHPLPFKITCITSDAMRLKTEIGIGSAVHPLEILDHVIEKEKAEIFARARVLVHPSLHEGFGLTPFEAFLLGANVVARPLSVFKEIYGEDIFYFNSKKDFNSAVSRALETNFGKERREKYRKRALSHSDEKLSAIFKKQKQQLPTFSKRIAFLGSTLVSWGGGEKSKMEIVEDLREEGFEVQFVGWRRQSRLLNEHLGIAHEVFRHENEIGAWLRKSRPGFVICDQRLALLAFPFLQELSIPYAIIFQFWAPYFTRTNRLLEARPAELVHEPNKNVIYGARFLIANSDYTKKVLKKHFNLDAVICYPDVDKKKFRGEPGRKKERNAILTTLLEEDRQGGLDLYEKIVQRLPNRRFVALTFRGDRKKADELQTRYPNLTILDGVADPRKYFHSARVYLYTLQIDHTFGRSFCEAALTQTPIVAPNLGNPPLLLPKSGTWLETLDPARWVEVIEKHFTNEKFYKSKIQNAKKESKSLPNHDTTEVIERTKKILYRPVKTLLTNKRGFPAGFRCFKSMAKLCKEASFETGAAETLVFFGAPEHSSELVSPNSFSYWASTPLQSSIDGEMPWLEKAIKLVREGRLGGILFADQKMAELAKILGCPKAYFVRPPAPLLIAAKKSQKRLKDHVSLYLTDKSRKNLMNQLLAIREVGGLTVHVPEKLLHEIPFGLVKELNFVRHPYLPDPQYFELIASCSAGLQVTIGESFNFTAFEQLALGVPCLVSRSAKFANDFPANLSYLRVEDIENVDEIAQKLKEALGKKRDSVKLKKFTKEWGSAWNKKFKKEFLAVFS